MRNGLAALGVFLLVLSSHAFHAYSVDEVHYYGMAVGLIERGRLTLSPCWGEPWLVPAEVPGECYTVYGPGQAAVMAPFVALAPASSPALRVRSATLVGPVLGALLFLALARRIGPGRSLLLFFGTPLWFYARTEFSETLRTLLVFLATGAWFDERPRGAFFSGLALGGAILTRLDTIVLLPAFAACERRRDRALGFLAPLGLALGAYGAYNLVRFGSPLALGGYGEYTENLLHAPLDLLLRLAQGAAAYLISPGTGLFFFAPIAFLGLRRVRGGFEAMLLACALLPIPLYANTINWASGWNWGPRYLHLTWTLLGVLALSRTCSAPRLRAALGAAFAWGFGMNLAAVAADYTFHHRRVMDPARVAWDPSAWPPVGQLRTLAEGRWDLPLWTAGTWPVGALLLLTGGVLLGFALRPRRAPSSLPPRTGGTR